MLRRIDSQWFALADLILVLVCGFILIIKPDIGFWPIGIALLPWLIRLGNRRFPFHKTKWDILIFVFFASACIGVWSAYDQEVALQKFLFISTSVLLYYSLVGQTSDNIQWIAGFFFLIGVSIAVYFFLTHDFLDNPRRLEIVNKIGVWFMDIRPKLDWFSIHPNYVAGLVILLSSLVYYPLFQLNPGKTKIYLVILVTLGLGLIGGAFFMATSRGALFALFSGLSIWVIWNVGFSGSIFQNGKLIRTFPIVTIGILLLAVFILFVGPAQKISDLSSQGNYGNGSRFELVQRSLYLIKDFQFIGGGLGAFPGLYSWYILSIPVFFVINSHNLFLDVAIEQGLFGGFAFLLLYLLCIGSVSKVIVTTRSLSNLRLGFLILFAFFFVTVHGMVDDYLYNQTGSILSLFLPGLAMYLIRDEEHNSTSPVDDTKGKSKSFRGYLSKAKIIYLSGFTVSIILLGILLFRPIISVINSNLGSVRMAKLELKGFPTNEWYGKSVISQFESVEPYFLKSIQYNPENQTANYRLGIIALQRQDFKKAVSYLEKAYRAAPRHRGIIKELGYSYLWFDKIEPAQELLEKIPEAKDELDVYSWWWTAKGEIDLANRAHQMIIRLK